MTPVGRDEARNLIAAMRTNLGATTTYARPEQSAPVDERTRLRRYVDLLQGHLHRNRDRAQAYELALAEIATLTRKLTGETTVKVHEIASAALSLEDPGEPPSQEAFT